MNKVAELNVTAEGGVTVNYQAGEGGSGVRWHGDAAAIERIRETLILGQRGILVAHPGVLMDLDPGDDLGRSLGEVYLAMQYAAGVRASVEVVLGDLGPEFAGIFDEDEITLPEGDDLALTAI